MWFAWFAWFAWIAFYPHPKPIEKPKEIREIGLRTIMKAVMDRMADLDKLKPNEEPKKEPKGIPEKRNRVIDSFKIVRTKKNIFLKLNLCKIFFHLFLEKCQRI